MYIRLPVAICLSSLHIRIVRRLFLSPACALEIPQGFHEGIHVGKFTVYRRKANVGNLIHFLELFQHQLANLHGGDLLPQGILQFSLDLVDDLLRFYGTLTGGFQNTGHELGSVEQLLRAVLFHHHDLHGLDHFKRCKSLGTGQAFTPAADAVAVVNGAGIDDLTFRVCAYGTLHEILLKIVVFHIITHFTDFVKPPNLF